MKTILKVFIAALILAFACLPSYASIIVDQNQPSAAVYMAAFEQTDIAQSFEQSNNNIAGAGIFLQPGIGSTDNVTISLWNALPNQGGSLLASGSGIGTQGNWVDVFWSPVSVTPNTPLYLVFTSVQNTLGIAGDTDNPYSRGEVYANPGFRPFPNFDYTFRTYADNQLSGSVPEPATLLLIGTGVAGLGIFRKRMTK